MSRSPAQASSSVITGNTFDKYGSSNPVVRRLMTGFAGNLGELLARAAPESILDVGCGEGVLTAAWARDLTTARIVGLDLADPSLEREWHSRARPNLRFVAGTARALPFAEDEFDLVAAIESLEHAGEPDRVLAEMARVSRAHMLISVPREPLWRTLNVARGAYLRRLGDTPGHVNHWSRRELERLLARHGDVIEVRTPFPWVMALVYTA
jgi:2-polyprenyl-3-methyl-5-hydroxy-6-metoxy-1,4-benzoquinol methylase